MHKHKNKGGFVMFRALGNLLDNTLGLIVFIVLFPLWLTLFLVALPVIAVIAIVNLCMNYANNPAIKNALAKSPELRAKFAEVENLQFDDNKKLQANNLIAKLQTLQDSAGNTIEINSEIKQELRNLRHEIKTDFNKQEFVALKKELKKQVHDLGKVTGDKNLLFATQKPKKQSLLRTVTEKEDIQTPLLFKSAKISLLSKPKPEPKLILQRG